MRLASFSFFDLRMRAFAERMHDEISGLRSALEKGAGKVWKKVEDYTRVGATI